MVFEELAFEELVLDEAPEVLANSLGDLGDDFG
jgi:hypothetical protein